MEEYQSFIDSFKTIQTIDSFTNIENYNFHYLCSYCNKIPKIHFIDENKIQYTCDCNDGKILNIQDLFEKDKNYFLTILDTDKINKNNDLNNYQNSSFRCKKHKKKQHKFRYYCISCKENLCKECCLYHYKEKHELITLDFYYYDFYQKLLEINKKLILENGQRKFIYLNDGNVSIEKNNHFYELLNIIISDYLNYPNYNHFANIDEIYHFYVEKEYKINLKYKTNSKNDNIKLFGKEFVLNNKNNFQLYIDNKKYELNEFYENKNHQEYIDVSLIPKDTIKDISHMFNGTPLIEISSNFSDFDTSNISNMSHLFNDCVLLESLPDLSKWNTSKVEKIDSIFNKCKSINYLPNISKWNISKVSDISYIFCNCKSLK